jgi:hypothetical protein
MLNAIRSSLMFVALSALVPVVFYGEALACRGDCCCRVCRQTQCVCPQSTCPPIVQRDVVTTEYRNEPVVETVPSTVYENVMVDEGSYQTVWVPRLTTKSVARTVYQTRTSCRTVPYQVTRRVNDFGTQIGQAIPTATAPLVYAPPAYSVSALPYRAAPTTPTGAASSNPVPDPRFSAAPTTPIVPRTASSSNSSSISSSTSDIRSADRGPSLFSPAPSAAQVWRTPRGTVAR